MSGAVRTRSEATAKRLVALWNGAWPSTFSAQVGSLAMSKPASVNVYALKNGTGYLILIWRPDRSLIDCKSEDCIAGGRKALSKSFPKACAEGVGLLLRMYGVDPYSLANSAPGRER